MSQYTKIKRIKQQKTNFFFDERNMKGSEDE